MQGLSTVVYGALNHEFLNDTEVKIVRALAGFKPEFDRLGLGDPAHAPLAEKMKAYIGGLFYDGEIGSEHQEHRIRRTLVVSQENFSALVGAQRGAEGELLYFDPAKLRDALPKIETEYFSLPQLSAAALAQIKTVCSYKGLPQLSARALGPVSGKTFQIIRGLGNFSGQFVSKRLVALCADIMREG